MDAGDSTVRSFPTYADLTQTQGWTRSASSPVSLGAEVTMPSDDRTRYTERALLGTGGMGKVMLAHDARVGRDVAVKQLHEGRELAADERARFLREARVQGQLEHPSIVPVYDIDQRPDGTTFFTMRRVVGRTLQAIVEDLRAGDPLATGRYTQRELLTAFATICLTIDYAHSRGVIHRDLKPANLMLGDFGEVYVLDWGLARILADSEGAPSAAASSERLSMPGELMGTPIYMAPEQMQDPAVGAAADVFSLGAILFELLAHERLRDAATIYLPADARTSIRAPSRNVAPELEAICVRATETEPGDRYPTPRALQEAVVRFLDGDRDREQRQKLAAEHARRAGDAFDRAAARGSDHEQDRGMAIREIARAVALDPTNPDYVGTLASTLASPPSDVPAEVHAELRKENERIIRSGAGYSIIGMGSWFIFLPILFVIGVRDHAQLVAIIVPATIALALSVIAYRARVINRAIQIALLLSVMTAAVMTSRLFGPLVVMPTLLTTYTVVLQSHPWRQLRRFSLGAALVAITMPIVLEIAGVIASSHTFEAGRWIIEPQLLELSASTPLLLLVVNLVMVVVPCIFIARLRSTLSDVQTRQLVQGWQFRRLGDELVQKAI